MGELRLYNVCMQVQILKVTGLLRPAQATFSSPVSTSLPVPQPLQGCLLLWCLAAPCCCCPYFFPRIFSSTALCL